MVLRLRFAPLATPRPQPGTETRGVIQFSSLGRFAPTYNGGQIPDAPYVLSNCWYASLQLIFCN